MICSYHKNCPRSFFGICFIFTTFLLTAVSYTAGYEVTYSGGEYHATWDSSSDRSPYRQRTGAWTGFWGCDVRPAGVVASVLCYGTITATFRWNGGPTQVPPPATVAVFEQCRVDASGYDIYCDNGLESPVEWFPPYAASSVGAKCRIIQEPGEEFTVTCEPFIWAYKDGPPLVNAIGIVAYKAEAVPLELQIGGATSAEERWNALIGQGLQLWVRLLGVLPSGFEFRNYNWTVPGEFSKGITGAPPISRGIAVHQPIDYRQPVFRLFYDKELLEQDLQCDFDIYYQGEKSTNAIVKKKLRVWEPAYDASITRSYGSRYLPDAETATRVEAAFDDQTEGIYFVGSATTPAIFGAGSGEWGFVQLINLDRSFTTTQGIIPCTTRGDYFLDNWWPYRNWWVANGSPHEVDDRPYHEFPNNCYRYSISDSFKMFHVYRPPIATGGTGSFEVPLRRLDWSWSASGERTLKPLTAWSGPGGGVFTGSAEDMPVKQLVWTRRFLNGIYP